ncbi:LysR family transcriptional regulator [uncultured Sphingomonas sp.]|uniref:LysR family transcriptional regulator n=1 Tax=uncultured Sphingomonas sp. TaxID=158754 RepID=UPI0025F84A4B|nr:LysR family transcriptional regulator [uncultured Sphingomonas sp.]
MRRTPSLSSLRLFMQVAVTSSFSETARLANLSQPALSRTIKLLEEELGVRLFDRNSRNVALTPAGAALLPTVERLAGEFDLAFEELRQTFAGQRGRVIVGALPSAAAHILPTIIADFRRTHPQVEIILRDNLSGALYQQMLDRLVDFAITTPPGLGEGFRFDPIMDDECVLVSRREEADAIAAPADWAVFAQSPFIAMEARSSVRLLTDSAFAKTDMLVRPLYECAQLATVGGLVSAGLGITLLPRSTLPMLGVGGDIAWRSMAPPHVSRTIGIARLENRSLSPAAKAFMDAVRGQAMIDADS